MAGKAAAKVDATEVGTRAYVAIAAVMILVIVGLLSGIVWYNFDKTRALTIMSAERLLAETGDKTINRLRLFYEPVITVVALASRVPQIATTDAGSGSQRPALMMTGLQRYPQLFSLYVGFDDGGFEMVTRVSGDERAATRQRLGAPDNAVFAHELIEVGSDGAHHASWTFLTEDGAVIDSRAAAETTYDPRERQWYSLARDNDELQHSEPYLFASSREMGITLSRRLEGGARPGAFGADLSLREVSSFLAQQKVTASSIVFIFNDRGEVVAYPDETKIRREVTDSRTSTIVPTKISDLGNPAAQALFDQYQSHKDETWMMDAAGQSYLARAAAFPVLLDRSDFLGVLAPLPEITGDVDEIRTEALLGSVLILLLTLPVFLTVIFVWIDVRLGRKPFSIGDFIKADFGKADDERHSD